MCFSCSDMSKYLPWKRSISMRMVTKALVCSVKRRWINILLVVLKIPTRGRLYTVNAAGEFWFGPFIHKLNMFFCFCSILSGITRFDLLGDYGRYNWLGNFYIVFLYNMMFAGLTSASLIKTVTWAVQRELIRAFGQSTFISVSWNKTGELVCIYFCCGVLKFIALWVAVS